MTAATFGSRVEAIEFLVSRSLALAAEHSSSESDCDEERQATLAAMAAIGVTDAEIRAISSFALMAFPSG